MALQLNVNSYVSVAEADSYLTNDRIDTAEWVELAARIQAELGADSATAEAAANAVKEAALIHATRVIDAHPWIGSVVDPSQPLNWPRTGASYCNPYKGITISFEENVVPAEVKLAVCEQVLYMMINEDLFNVMDNSPLAQAARKSSSDRLSELKVDSIQLKFEQTNKTYSTDEHANTKVKRRLDRISEEAFIILQPLLDETRSVWGRVASTNRVR